MLGTSVDAAEGTTMRKRLVVAAGMTLAMLVSGTAVASARPASEACGGQASKVFAQIGLMGEHSSSFDSPRLGLRNLARTLADAGVIEDDSMQALGRFVADELGLEIDACARS
jgi:hypothetical protein